MPAKPIVGGRYLVTWAELGSPRVVCEIHLADFGTILIDDADVHYATTTPNAAFWVKESRALGPEHFVVVARVHSA